MDWWLQTVAIIGMFILRLGVPLAITLAVGYWLRQLDAKWQAEALARQAEAVLVAQEKRTEPDLEIFRIIEQPCWVLKNCPDEAYPGCPAYARSELPCWLARLRAEGRLPQQCYRCKMFTAGKIAHHHEPVN